MWLLELQGMKAVSCCRCEKSTAETLNAGASIGNLHIRTICADERRFGQDKLACLNCTHAFKDRVKGNYSGWTSQKGTK